MSIKKESTKKDIQTSDEYKSSFVWNAVEYVQKNLWKVIMTGAGIGVPTAVLYYWSTKGNTKSSSNSEDNKKSSNNNNIEKNSNVGTIGSSNDNNIAICSTLVVQQKQTNLKNANSTTEQNIEHFNAITGQKEEQESKREKVVIMGFERKIQIANFHIERQKNGKILTQWEKDYIDEAKLAVEAKRKKEMLYELHEQKKIIQDGLEFADSIDEINKITEEVGKIDNKIIGITNGKVEEEDL